MTTLELAKLVADMRVTQRVYFKERKHAQLEEAKKREEVVDKAVKEILLFHTTQQ